MKERAPKWIKNRLDRKKTVVFIVGLKADLPEREVEQNEILELKNTLSSEIGERILGEIEIFEVSSKTNSKVVDLFIAGHNRWKQMKEESVKQHKQDKKEKRNCIIN